MSKVYFSKTLNRQVVSFQGNEYPVEVWGLSNTLHPTEIIDQDIKKAIYITTKRTLMSLIGNPDYVPTFTYVERTNEYFVSIARGGSEMMSTNIGMVNENDLDTILPDFVLTVADAQFDQDNIFTTVPSGFFFDEKVRLANEKTKPTVEELLEAFNTGIDMATGLEAVFQLGQRRHLAK